MCLCVCPWLWLASFVVAIQPQPPQWWPALLPPAIGLLLGWAMLAYAKGQNRRNFIYDRAPSLPLRVLAEHDDAWIAGRVFCVQPLRIPYFGADCVYYEYKIEKEVTETYTDSKGKRQTRTEWQTEHEETQAVRFFLTDGDAEILVRIEDAELHHLESTGYDYEWGSRRHWASYLPVGASISALGVKLEDRSFGRLGEVPLVLTTKDRQAFQKGSDRREAWLRFLGFFFIFLGGTVGCFLLLQAVLEPSRHGLLWLSPLAGLLLLVPFWFISTYNRFVRAHQQAETAWRQIDVDLSVRGDLLPNLLRVVDAYKKHEAELFEKVARLRSDGAVNERVRQEGKAVRVSRQLLALVERYPELEANELFMDLHQRLWALEEKLAASRSFYNGLAREWNDLVQKFPSLLVAKVRGHKRREYFALDRPMR